jgi:hypothetical protein
MNPAVPGGRGLGRGYFARGGGFGRGGGRGFRNWYYATGLPGWQRAGMGLPAWGGQVYPYSPELTPKQEADALKAQAKAMQDEINAINERIKELESATKTDKEK